MCGCLVVVERGRPVDQARARAALGSLRHRGPDGSGEAIIRLAAERMPASPPVEVYLGHNRLAILDLSARSAQPFRRAGRAIVYNGELYDFRALRAELERASGRRLTTSGDVEVLHELIGTRGLAGLAAANGMWAFCQLDEETGTLAAVRDRYGKKPLYYYRDATTLCVASEITAILAYLGRAPRLLPSALAAYLAHGWLFPGPRSQTHLEAIEQVRPGCAAVFDLARWEMREERCCGIEAALDRPLPEADRLADDLERAVVERLVSDRQVGLLLSGGIDSSLIASVLAARGLAGQVKCYTGEAGKSEDARYAGEAIAALGIKAKVVPLDYGESGFERFLKVCRHQEKPFPFIGNVLAMPQMYQAIAADGVPVVIDGTGGDEIFGGYFDRTWRYALADAVRAGDEAWLAAAVAAHADDPKLAALARDTIAAVRSGAWADGTFEWDAQTRIPYLAEVVTREILAAPSTDPLATFRGSFGEALRIDVTAGRLQEWLWQNDRNAMLAGIENRSPFLDWRLARYQRTDFRGKMAGPWNKLELRALFDRFVPLSTRTRRQKQGFRFVYGRFLQANRARVLELIAAAEILRGGVDLARYLALARQSDDALASELTQRLLCLAGLEAATGMRLG